MLKVGFRGDFLKKLHSMQTAYKGTKISATLRVQPGEENNWWAYQEFGTASKSDTANLPEGYTPSGHPYKITATNAPLLVFEVQSPEGGTQLMHVKEVTHPGVPPKRYITKVLPEIEATIQQLFKRAMEFHSIDNPDQIKGFLRQAAERAKEIIVDSMVREFTNPVDEYGKLGNEHPAQAFERMTYVSVEEE